MEHEKFLGDLITELSKTFNFEDEGIQVINTINIKTMGEVIQDALENQIQPFEEWADEIINRTVACRNLDIPPENYKKFLISEIQNLNFDDNHRAAVEYWLLKGNWTYKKTNTITVTDFFPQPGQVEEIMSEYVSRETFKKKYDLVMQSKIREWLFIAVERAFRKFVVQDKESDNSFALYARQVADNMKLGIELDKIRKENEKLRINLRKKDEIIAVLVGEKDENNTQTEPNE